MDSISLDQLPEVCLLSVIDHLISSRLTLDFNRANQPFFPPNRPNLTEQDTMVTGGVLDAIGPESVPSTLAGYDYNLQIVTEVMRDLYSLSLVNKIFYALTHSRSYVKVTLGKLSTYSAYLMGIILFQFYNHDSFFFFLMISVGKSRRGGSQRRTLPTIKGEPFYGVLREQIVDIWRYCRSHHQ